MRPVVLAAIPLTALLSCEQVPPEEPEDGLVLLSARERLIRLSVDLRGIHPSEAELVAIEANPDLYAEYVDRYLQDPRFLDRVEEIFNVSFRTRTGALPAFADNMDNTEVFRGLTDEQVADAIAEEPLELIRKITEEDLPFTEIVTADYTMANHLTAYLWSIGDYPEGATEWLPAHYADGREHSGVLSMTTLWTRYPSAGANENRHRANNLARILLCDDYLARPVSFSRTQIDALVSGDPNDVITSTATCQSCHSSLDPLSAHFFGYWWEVEGDWWDQTTYRPEDEDLWRTMHGKAPGYFGRPTHSLQEMALELADDERFVDCAVETVFEGLTQRDVADEDWTELRAHRDVFADGGLVVRDLVRSIVTSREYQAGEVTDETRAERIATVKMVSPAQLGGIIADKTGYRWEFDGRDGLSKNVDGLAVLSGGIDSVYVTTPSHDPSVGIVFVQERLAQAAGHHVARNDLDPERTGPAILLGHVSVDSRPETDRDAFAGQIRALYLEVTGVALEETEDEEAPEIEALIHLWKELYSVEASPQTAWAGVVSVVLRDPRVILY